MNTMAEPTPASFDSAIARYLAATRPAFLSATLVACLIGLASVVYSGLRLNAFLAGMTLLLALLVHAAVNVLNDYYDALNGTDDANTERLFPFTGGSRFIQNGMLTPWRNRTFRLRDAGCRDGRRTVAGNQGRYWLAADRCFRNFCRLGLFGASAQAQQPRSGRAVRCWRDFWGWWSAPISSSAARSNLLRL